MVGAAVQARCLFTNDPLDGATKEEHTLQRTLGGRFRSTRVTSSTFNGDCSPFDDALHSAYATLFSQLRPLLAAEHRQGALDVEIGGHDFRVGDDGVADVVGLEVTARDAAGKPTEVRGDPEAVRRFARRNNWDEGNGWTYDEFHVGAGIGHRFNSMLSAEMELAALKAILATFDVALENDPERFTRTAVDDVLGRIRDAVAARGSEVELTRVARLSRGIDYAQRDKMRALRDSLRPGSHQASELEHFVVASGDSRTGFIHLGWLLADVDPWCFRVAGFYKGPDFTAVTGCGVVVGTHPWERAVTVPEVRWTTGCLTPMRGDHSTTRISRADMEAAAAKMTTERQHACRRATDLVERSANDWVIEQFREAGHRLGARGGAAPEMVDILHERLRVLFSDRLKEGDGEPASALASAVRPLPQATREQRIDNMTPDAWLSTYRDVLDTLKPRLGLPGAFTSLITQAQERPPPR